MSFISGNAKSSDTTASTTAGSESAASTITPNDDSHGSEYEENGEASNSESAAVMRH